MSDLYFTSVVVSYGYAGSDKYGWWARVDWLDGKHCEDGAMRGRINTEYASDLGASIDYVMQIIERFEISSIESMGIALFYEGDGENSNHPPPEGWKEILRAEAEKRGWKTYPKDSA